MVLALIVGGEELDAVYTFLKKVYVIEDGIITTEIDIAKSIYIDWGAFITAVIDFLIIAFVLFTLLKVVMSARGYFQETKKSWPTRQERKQLKEQGVNMRDVRAVVAATAPLRAKNTPAPEPVAPTQEELLTQILAELKKQNELVCECGEDCDCHKEEAEEKSVKKERKKKAE